LSEIKHHFAAGVYAREMSMDAPGQIAVTHMHNYDHLSYLAEGRVCVTVDGLQTTYDAPAMIVIAKGKSHCIEALTAPVRWLCIHGVPEGVEVDDVESVLIEG